MKRPMGPLMLFSTKLTSLPIDMTCCVWKDWFEDFKSSKKGKGVYSSKPCLSGISFLFAHHYQQPCLSFWEKSWLDRSTALGLHGELTGARICSHLKFEKKKSHSVSFGEHILKLEWLMILTSLTTL